MAVIRRAGIRNRFVSLFRGPITTNDSDGYAEALNPAQVWVAIQPTAPGTFGDGSRIHYSLVTMDYHSQMTVDCFLTYGTRTLLVKDVQNVDDANVEMRLICEEVTP